jgi:hypothetical protein
MAAKVISAIYALVMMAVLVGLVVRITEDGHLAPQSLILYVLFGGTVIAASLHPQEFWCLLAGLAFYVTIPSTYLLLIVYAIFNLNVVSWGTREVATKMSKMVRHFLWLSVSIVYIKIGLSGSPKIILVFCKRQFATANEFYSLLNKATSYVSVPILKVYKKIIIPSFSGFYKWPLSFRFFLPNNTYISLLPVHDTRPTHIILLSCYHTTNIL